MIQCPYCDSTTVKKIHGHTYECVYCGKLFAHYAEEDLVITA